MNKKLFSLFVIIIIALSLSCVSANDSSIISDNSSDIVGVSNDEPIIYDSGNAGDEAVGNVSNNVGTYTDLNNEINNAGSTLILDKDYKYNSTSDSGLATSGIVISKDITIDGAGHTIDGSGNSVFGNSVSRLFVINTGSFTLKNLNIVNVTFWTGISSFPLDVGVIRLNGGTLSLDNLTFQKCSVNTMISAPGQGNLNMVNCAFLDNKVANLIGITQVNMKMDNNIFLNNSIEMGCLINDEASTFSSISNNVFLNNKNKINVYYVINCNNNYWGSNSASKSNVGTFDECNSFSAAKLTITGDDSISEVANYQFSFGNTNLPTFTLPVSITNEYATVNTTVTIKNGVGTVTVTPKATGNATLTVGPGLIKDSNTKAISINYSKIQSSMVVAAENIKYGNDAVITATLTPTTATGNVTFTINGKTENANIVDGVASATFKDLTPGDYIVNVNYDGDDACDGSTNSTSFNVAKADSDVVISVDDVVYGGDVTVVAAVSSGATGNVTFTVNGVNKSAAVVDGKANATFSNLGAGDYSVVASYEGDNNYKASNSTAKFNVAKADANLDVSIADVDYQNIFTIEAVLTGINGAKLTGDVMVSINNILLFTVKVVDGNGTFAGDTLIVGSYNFTARWAGNDNYNNIKSEGVFKVNKIDSNITVNADDIKVGENATVTVNVSSDATGDVIITVDGKNYTVAIVDGKAVKTIADLKANNYTVTVKYSGDNNYNPNQNTTKFTVSKISDYNMNITVPGDVKVGEDAVIIVNVPKDASGNVTVSVGKDVYNAVISNGSVKVVVSGLDAGNYSVVASYDGDNNYKASNSTAKFNVAKADVDVKINVGDIKVGETAIITVIVSPGVTGNVTVIVNGKSETVNVTDGNATLKVANLAANKYDVTVIYNGNDNYNVAKANASFVVSKVSDYKMNVTVPTIIAGENVVIEVSLPKDATNNVTVVINNKKYTAAVLNGSAKVIIPGLTAGKYNMSVSYSGDDKYTQSSANFNITVEANKNVNLNISDIVMIYKDGTRMVAVLTDYLGNPIANAIVYFTINGQTYNKTTDANGTASMGLNLVSNVYQATVSYNGSDMYNAVSKNITVTINPTIVADDLVKMYQNATRFYAKFTDSTGKALANTIVRFNIHGVFYNKTTDKDGVADLGIMLRPGNYILTAYNPVTGEEKGFNITVKSLIVQSDLTKYYLNASRFEATVYNKDGSLAVNKNVTFNINGVFYTKTTDKHGVASLGISLRPGNYTITTMYDGLDIGNKVTVMPTLVTKDLSMKYLDGINFTALTLDGQGKPLANQNVSFNVNGVFYHKVTNKDGIASLGIRLMSGEYIITSYWNDFQTGNTIKISS